MLKIAVIEDEQHILAQIVVNILAFDEREKLKVKPFWIKREDQDPRMFDEEIIEELKHLKNKDINQEPESVVTISNVTEPENFRKLIEKLKKYKPHLIFCDAGLGGNVLNRELGVLIVEEMSKEYRGYPWHCWIVSQYDQITIRRDLKSTDGSSSKFKLGSRHIEKDEVIGAGEGECPERIAGILNDSLAQIAEIRGVYGSIIGESEKLLEVIALASRCAESDVSVLILGESGTGKELLTDLIQDNSERRTEPYIRLNCGSIPETLLESELFGHERGAFTDARTQRIGHFENADGGTLFLDEIGELSPQAQVKLLRVLQNGELTRVGGNEIIRTDVRVIAATNVDLAKAVEEGNFRKDLYYRLSVYPITLPPLRERREDIPLLMNHFLDRLNREHNKNVKITPTAVKKLQEYNFPGNIRELENIITGAFLRQMGGTIDEYDLPENFIGKHTALNLSETNEDSKGNLTYKEFRQMSEEQIWQKVKSSKGNIKLDLRTINNDDAEADSEAEIGKCWKYDSKRCYNVLVLASQDFNNHLSNAECELYFNIKIRALRRKVEDKGYDKSILSSR